jgi:hypothetical protein
MGKRLAYPRVDYLNGAPFS